MYLSTADSLPIWLSGVYRRMVSVSKNLIESTSIHVNYDKLPLIDSTNKKLGKALDLDSEILVSGFTKLKGLKRLSEKDKVKQKITGPSLRDKKLKSSGKQKTTGKSPRDKKSRSSGKQALSKKAVHEDVASDAEEAEMEDTVVDNEAAASEPIDDNNNIEDSQLYKRVKKRDLR